MESSVQIVEIPILRYVPELLAWLFGVALALLMVRRGGGRAEKLFLAGCILMFVNRLASPLLSEILQVVARDMGALERAQTVGNVLIPLSILGLGGLVCLAWAFWARFRGKRQVPA